MPEVSPLSPWGNLERKLKAFILYVCINTKIHKQRYFMPSSFAKHRRQLSSIHTSVRLWLRLSFSFYIIFLSRYSKSFLRDAQISFIGFVSC